MDVKKEIMALESLLKNIRLEIEEFKSSGEYKIKMRGDKLYQKVFIDGVAEPQCYYIKMDITEKQLADFIICRFLPRLQNMDMALNNVSLE